MVKSKLPILRDEPILSEVEQLFAPPDDPVFQLVPPEFDVHAKDVYQRIGAPAQIRIDNFWAVFERMHEVFEGARAHLAHHIPYTYDEQEEDVRLLEGYQEMIAPGPLILQSDLSNQSVFNRTIGRTALIESALPTNGEDMIDPDEPDLPVKKEGEEDDVTRLMLASVEDLSRVELFDCLFEFTDSEEEADEDDADEDDADEDEVNKSL